MNEYHKMQAIFLKFTKAGYRKQFQIPCPLKSHEKQEQTTRNVASMYLPSVHLHWMLFILVKARHTSSFSFNRPHSVESDCLRLSTTESLKTRGSNGCMLIYSFTFSWTNPTLVEKLIKGKWDYNIVAALQGHLFIIVTILCFLENTWN